MFITVDQQNVVAEERFTDCEVYGQCCLAHAAFDLPTATTLSCVRGIGGEDICGTTFSGRRFRGDIA